MDNSQSYLLYRIACAQQSHPLVEEHGTPDGYFNTGEVESEGWTVSVRARACPVVQVGEEEHAVPGMEMYLRVVLEWSTTFIPHPIILYSWVTIIKPNDSPHYWMSGELVKRLRVRVVLWDTYSLYRL